MLQELINPHTAATSAVAATSGSLLTVSPKPNRRGRTPTLASPVSLRRIVMRGFRSLFVVASIGVLGIASFAGYPTDRDAVTDLQAAQFAGGLTTVATSCGYFQGQSCIAPCAGSCYVGSGSTAGAYGTPATPVGCGGNSSCNQVRQPDVCFKSS